MNIKKLDVGSVNEWVARLLADRIVYAPQARGDKFVYDRLEKSDALRLDFDVTVLPPKMYLQPPCERLLRFKGDSYTSVFDGQPFVIFGVHPYDMEAICQMDEVFAADNYDAHYMERRKQAAIVVCDPQSVSANTFAGCMGTAVMREAGDVLLTFVGDGYVVQAHTATGEALLKMAPRVAPAGDKDLAAREKVWAENERRMRKHELKVAPRDLPALLEGSYEHPVWQEKAQKCFSCGSCNLVCPTCYCFNVQENVDYDLQSGERVRVWDGCMLSGFATVAGGHNFRKDRAERYRHRYYRKGKYLHDRYQQIACVGCGRCIGACVTKIANPVEIYNTLAEK